MGMTIAENILARNVSFAFADYANLWGNPQPFVEQFMTVASDLVRRGATSFKSFMKTRGASSPMGPT